MINNVNGRFFTDTSAIVDLLCTAKPLLVGGNYGKALSHMYDVNGLLLSLESRIYEDDWTFPRRT